MVSDPPTIKIDRVRFSALKRPAGPMRRAGVALGDEGVKCPGHDRWGLRSLLLVSLGEGPVLLLSLNMIDRVLAEI